MCTSVDASSNWAQILSLSSNCPWIPVSPHSGTWTWELPRLQPHCYCWYRPSFSQHTSYP